MAIRDKKFATNLTCHIIQQQQNEMSIYTYVYVCIHVSYMDI